MNAASAHTSLTSTISSPKRRSGLSDPYFASASAYGNRRNGVGHLHADLPEDQLDEGLDHCVDGLRPRKRHLDVHLRELRLPVGAQVFVTEAFHNLEVAIGTANHQDLLEDLRGLRQRVELAGMNAARHEVVAGALGRGLRQDRRLDFPETLLVEVAANGHRHAMPQPEVVLQARTPQVQVPKPQPHILGHIRIVGNRERRRLCLVQDADLTCDDLHFAGGQLRVDGVGRAGTHLAGDTHDVLGPQPLRRPEQRVVDHDLREAAAITDIDEQHAAQIAHAMHPAKQRDFLSDIGRTYSAARVGSGQ